jgi:tellurite resistance protein
MALKAVDLTHVGSERLRAAMRTTIEQQAAQVTPDHHIPSSVRLQQSATAAIQQSNEAEARYFQSILELAYLVASSDGFVEAEQRALADLLEQVTGAAVSHAALELHFKDLEDACSVLGRKERLRRAAADFDDAIGRDEALGFAALVALADGKLREPEAEALLELAHCLEFEQHEAQNIVDAVVIQIQKALDH